MDTQGTPIHQGNALESLFQGLPADIRRILMLGGIPHRLDPPALKVLFADQSESTLAVLKKFRFVSITDSDSAEYHVLARSHILRLWQQEPHEFRSVSRALADEYYRWFKENPGGMDVYVEEWLYHLVASEPAEGLDRAANLFHEYVESQELGAAERLVRLIHEQEIWLAGYEGWLDYLTVFLDFCHYKIIEQDDLDRIRRGPPDSILDGYVRRLSGKIAVQKHRWDDGRDVLQKALDIFRMNSSTENQALVHLDLGDLYVDLVDSSGGILVDDREFKSLFHAALYVLTRVPLLLYRFLAERINMLPNLFGMNYQNWVALRLLRTALRHYRKSARFFGQLHNRRGEAETRNREASVLLALGYTQGAIRISRESLQDSVVRDSPFYSAQALNILARADHRLGKPAEAEEKLHRCLKIFEDYLDWKQAARSALELGQVREKLKKPAPALQTYERALKSARECRDALIETEIRRRVGRMARQTANEPFVSQKAAQLVQSIRRIAYIDRYTGPVSRAFRNLSHRLAYPFTFLFVIAVIVGSGITAQFIEGELRIKGLPPIVWSQSFDLIAGIFLPLLMIWGYYLLYALLGQVVTWRLSFRDVEDAHRDLYLLDDEGACWTGKNNDIRLNWHSIRTLLVDNRALYDKPMTFSSRAFLIGERDITIPASTFCYNELIAEIKKKLAENTQDGIILHEELSLLRTLWLFAALFAGLAISLALVGGLFSDPFYGCYQAIQDCPPEYRLYVQPIVQYGLLFASVIFMLVCLARWKWRDHRLSPDIAGKTNETVSK
jgi:tetratricopeptide (TPR) repeat protein